jgi:ornithine--oxo-acid transaminase
MIEMQDLCITNTKQYSYHPLPVVFSEAKGIWVTDPEGKRYMDFLSAYSAVNQGHCHPKIVQALCDQAQKLTLSSRAFYNDVFGAYAKYINAYFGYDMVLPVNTGSEAVETAIKLARKWGYVKKKIPDNEAVVLSCENNFHGRTTGVISMSTDPESYTNFGPYLPLVGPVVPDVGRIRYNNVEDLENVLNKIGDKVAAFLVEPIQGEAG